MDKQQALARIEILLSHPDISKDFHSGAAYGFIDACFHMGLLSFEECYALTRRALGFSVE